MSSRKGQLPISGTFMTYVFLLIVVALLFAEVMIFFIAFEYPKALNNMLKTFPTNMVGKEQLKYEIDFVQMSTKPFAMTGAITYVYDRRLIEESIMTYITNDKKYFNPMFALGFASFNPSALSFVLKAELLNYKDPSQKILLMKRVSFAIINGRPVNYCGFDSEGVCESSCSTGRKEESELDMFCSEGSKCCVEDDGSGTRCGLGICLDPDGDIPAGREPSIEHRCSGNLKCYVTADPTKYMMLEDVEVPIYFKGNLGYLRVTS
ncbi:MAG: hypothetical protein ABIG30_03915 [Candidatus Aenigmatarchaeota archaeon]